MSIGRVPGATGIQPSIVTAKGDLIVATASGSVTNQAVGTNNQVLMADSAQADGVKWANEATSTLTTTGDLLYASAANTLARRAIGSTGDVLTVSGGLPTWSAPASGGMTLISTTTLSGATTTISSIPQTYESLLCIISGLTFNTSNKAFRCFPNNSGGNGWNGIWSATVASGFTSISLSLGKDVTRTNADNVWALQFWNYTSTTQYKPFQFSGGADMPGTGVTQLQGAGYYYSTSAISSLLFDVEGTNTFSGGSIKLYGVK
jgi:hypothetical protein